MPPPTSPLARPPVNRRWLLAACAILLFAFALRLWHLNTESVWHDEGWSIRAIQGPFTTPDDNTPPLYYVAGHGLWRLSGAEGGAPPLLFRYVSVVTGGLTVAVTLWIGRRWAGAGAGLAAGLMVAAAPLLWEYSQEVRAYVAVPLFGLLLLDAAGRILRRRPGEPVPPRLWAYAFGVELATLYTHNLGVPLVVWVNAALGLVWLLRRDARRMLTWAGVQLALIAAYVPWLLTQSPSGTPLNTVPQAGIDLLREVWYAIWLPSLPQLQAAVAGDAAAAWMLGLDALGLLMVGAALVMAGRLLADAGRVPPRAVYGWLLLSHAILVPAASLALIRAASIDFHPRYFIAAVPGTLLLLALGGAGLSRGGRARAALLAGLSAAVLAVSAASLMQIRGERAYQSDDFRALAAYYATLPEDVTVLMPFETEPALQFYYAQVYDIRARFVNLPLYSDEAALLAALDTIDGPVELLTWFQLPADVRGMVPCVLSAASLSPPGEPRRFYGLMTQRYDSAPLDFAPLDLGPNFSEVMLRDAGLAASPYGICLRTTWLLQAAAQSLTGDLSAAVSVLAPNGTVIARADAPLARADNAPTSVWEAGDTGEAYTLLTLPAGAPLMAYTYALTLYTPAQPSGLDLFDIDGAPAGKRYVFTPPVEVAGPPLAGVGTPVLLADSTDGTQALVTGLPLALTLALPGEPGTTREAEVALRLGDWSAVERVPVTQDRLAWLRFVVPPGRDGEARLTVDGVEVARYTVSDPPRRFDLPEMAHTVGVAFPEVGTLAGLDAPGSVRAGEPFDVTLVWQAAVATDRPYTVFVQLVGADGRNLAQSDAMPAQGTRPTTGWVAGEVLLDTHTLRWNVTDFTGEATLIAGFYDADGGFRRLPTADGSDFAATGVTLTVTAGGG